jgi:uncharacterized protein (DUF488 family)
MEVYSIGFTKKTAEQFFSLLKDAGIRRLIDVRLNNVSQLAGFAKRKDLQFFLKAICDAEYVHEPLLAPTKEMLDAYKKHKGSWEIYEARFLQLMHERRIEEKLEPSAFSVRTVLLCSEPTPDCCHRRLVLGYLQAKWGGLRVTHL